MELRKLEQYEENESAYPQRVRDEFKELEKRLDPMTLEAVRDLAEMCYKDGLRDGLRFMDWICEKTH